MEMNEVIRRLREDRGLTQQNLANEISVDVSTINRWERTGKISSENLELLAKGLSTTVAELFNYKDNPSLLNEPLAFYKSKKKVSIMVELDGTKPTLNEWVLTLQRLNDALYEPNPA